MRAMNDQPDTRFLGLPSAIPASPEEAQLDYVPNPRPGALYLTRFAVPEFTSLCPVTAQPDFAKRRSTSIPRSMVRLSAA